MKPQEDQVIRNNVKYPEKSGTEDIFFKEKYEFLVSYSLRSKVMKTLKDNFKIREVIIIEEKDEVFK